MSDILSEIQKNQIEKLSLIYDGFLKYAALQQSKHRYDANIVMQLGNAKLYHFGGEGAPVVVIPSLVNKAYILDLDGCSFLKALRQKHTVYLIDWCEPSAEEQNFYTYHYIEYRIQPFIEAVSQKHEVSPSIVGYCMGGILALLYASQYQNNVRKIITIGMPYNFDCGHFIQTDTSVLEKMITESHVVNPEMLKAIFYLNNFAAVHKKYEGFASEISDQSAIIEYWVNDGVPVSKNMFFEFIDLLINKNSFFLDKQFNSCSIKYNIANIEKPIISIVGKYDAVVSHASASAIKTLTENVEVITYDTGHVGQIIKYAQHIAVLI